MEKIKVVNQCVMTLLYVSSQPSFLNIDNTFLANYLAQQLTSTNSLSANSQSMSATLHSLLHHQLHLPAVSAIR